MFICGCDNFGLTIIRSLLPPLTQRKLYLKNCKQSKNLCYYFSFPHSKFTKKLIKTKQKAISKDEPRKTSFSRAIMLSVSLHCVVGNCGDIKTVYEAVFSFLPS